MLTRARRMASRVAPARTPRAHVHRRDAAVSASCSAAPRRRVRSIAGCVGGRVGHPLAPGSRPGLSLEAESGARVGPLDACQLRATPTYRHRGRARLQSIGGCFALLTARSARSASSRARSALRSSPSADTGGARCRSSAVPSSFSVGRCTSGRCASVLRPVGTRSPAGRAGGRAWSVARSNAKVNASRDARFRKHGVIRSWSGGVSGNGSARCQRSMARRRAPRICHRCNARATAGVARTLPASSPKREPQGSSHPPRTHLRVLSSIRSPARVASSSPSGVGSRSRSPPPASAAPPRLRLASVPGKREPAPPVADIVLEEGLGGLGWRVSVARFEHGGTR